MIFRQFVGLAAAVVCTAALAADVKISALPNGGTALTSDQIPVNRSGTTTRVAVGPLATANAPTAHGVVIGQGASVPTSVAAMAADTLLQGQGASADPASVALLNCGDATHALAYSTSTHTFSCQTITTGAATTGTFTASLSGMTGATTGTLTWSVSGNIATLKNDTGLAITGTSNANSMSVTTLPAAIIPVSGVDVVCSRIVDNGLNLVGAITITGGASSATVWLEETTTVASRVHENANAFTTSGTKGIGTPFVCQWPLD
jgi:hypothetical protein